MKVFWVFNTDLLSKDDMQAREVQDMDAVVLLKDHQTLVSDHAQLIAEKGALEERMQKLETLHFTLVNDLAALFPVLDGDRANDPIMKRVLRVMKPEPRIAELAEKLAAGEIDFDGSADELSYLLEQAKREIQRRLASTYTEWELEALALERGLIDHADCAFRRGDEDEQT